MAGALLLVIVGVWVIAQTLVAKPSLLDKIGI